MEDETGKKLNALTVFSLTIKYLHDDALSSLNRQIQGGVENAEIHWVITVLAIWDEHAKQFMITAAMEVIIYTYARIPTNSLPKTVCILYG